MSVRTPAILLAIVWFASTSVVDAQVLSSGWGSTGTGNGQFNRTWGIATDGSHFVYLVDEYNHRIQKFDPSGNFVVEWGSFGTGDGQFNFPAGIAVDFYGTVYVADRFNNGIQKFVQANTCPAGTTQVAAGVCFERKWGTLGSGQGDFAFPVALAVEPPDAFGNIGNLYVADTSNYRVQMFTPNGTFLAAWGTQGTANGQFEDPWASRSILHGTCTCRIGSTTTSRSSADSVTI